MSRGIGAGHAVFAGVVLTERVIGRSHHDIGTTRAASILRGELVLGGEEPQVSGLGDGFGGRRAGA